jgi:hypothetical protein
MVALPVFVVVVGVDARWLRQAIRQHYAAMLPDDSVTPAHYLEKIFQIPFQLSPMDKEGFAGLVRDLAVPEDELIIDVVLPWEVLAGSVDRCQDSSVAGCDGEDRRPPTAGDERGQDA